MSTSNWPFLQPNKALVPSYVIAQQFDWYLIFLLVKHCLVYTDHFATRKSSPDVMNSWFWEWTAKPQSSRSKWPYKMSTLFLDAWSSYMISPPLVPTKICLFFSLKSMDLILGFWLMNWSLLSINSAIIFSLESQMIILPSAPPVKSCFLSLEFLIAKIRLLCAVNCLVTLVPYMTARLPLDKPTTAVLPSTSPMQRPHDLLLFHPMILLSFYYLFDFKSMLSK